QCNPSEISTQFPVGKMKYEAIIVPNMETIRASTLDRLEAFRGCGGKLIFLGPAPVLVDAVPDDRAQRLWDQSEHIGFDRLSILNSLEEYRDVSIRDSSGAVSRSFIYQYREDGSDIRWLFVSHADKESGRDIPNGDDYRIRIRGEWQALEYNTIAGTKTGLDAEITAGWTTVKARLWDHDSLLIRLVPAGNASSAKAAGARAALTLSPALFFNQKIPVTLSEPNVLLLDIADYALDNGEWRGREEILRLDNILRKELGWPMRSDAVAQPWVEHDASTPHTLHLRFTFQSEIDINGIELALENAAATKIALNGMPAAPVQGWYVDKCIGKAKLSEIKTGTNVLELTLPYGKKVDVESCYLLGNFSVKVQGKICTMGAPVASLAFGDITRQGLPFYGGNLVYHLEAECKASPGKSTGTLVIEASSWRFMLLKVAVDGKDRGVIAYAPYRLEIGGLAPGKHKIDITGFGCRVNTFGQLHNSMGHEGFWWGPNSWRTEGPGWSYEYLFWPQGVLKSPEIFQAE
ncbi:MAG: hypothetical protein FWF22_00175, partial [Treponema sp.]|nr:hypothetical protein [Treponema sp.]